MTNINQTMNGKFDEGATENGFHHFHAPFNHQFDSEAKDTTVMPTKPHSPKRINADWNSASFAKFRTNDFLLPAKPHEDLRTS